MTYLVALLSVAAFGWALWRIGAADSVRAAAATARAGLATLGHPGLSDDEKERAARASALQLTSASARILGGLGLASLTPLAILALPVEAGFVSLASLTQVLLSWRFVTASAIICLAALLLRRR